MALNTEILIFNTSEAYRESPKIATKALEYALAVEGAKSPAYYGTQIESSSTGYIFVNWDSHEAHKAFTNHPSFQATFAALKECFVDHIEIYDVQFSGPVVAAFEQPVTGILVLTLNAPENRDAVVDILTTYSKATGNVNVFGQTRQDENKYIVVSGWASVEAHREAAANPELSATVAKLTSLVNREHLFHTGLSEYRLP